MNLGNGLLLLLVGGCFFLMMRRGGGCCGGRHTKSNSCHRGGNESSGKALLGEQYLTPVEHASAKPEPHKGSSNKGALTSLALAAVLALGTYSPVWANVAHHPEQTPTPPQAASIIQPQETANIAVPDEEISKEKCGAPAANGKKEMLKPVMQKVDEKNSMSGASPMMGTMMNRKQGMETMMDMCKMTQQAEMRALPKPSRTEK